MKLIIGLAILAACNKAVDPTLHYTQSPGEIFKNPNAWDVPHANKIRISEGRRLARVSFKTLQ